MKCETCLHNEICRFNNIPTFGMDNVACQYEAHELSGEWIDTGYGTSRCSVCGEKCQTYCMDKPRDRYCLWCGASMSANDRQVIGKLDENTQKHYGFRKKY